MSKLARNWNASLRLKINIAVMLPWYWQSRKTKSQKGRQAKNRIKWITVGHIPDALVKILYPIMKTWKIHSTKAIIVEKHRAASEDTWVCNYELFWPKIHKFVREKIKNSDYFTLLFFNSFFHLTQSLTNGPIFRGLIHGPFFALVIWWEVGEGRVAIIRGEIRYHNSTTLPTWVLYTYMSKCVVVPKNVIFYLLWYNVIHWSSHIYKKSSFLSFRSFSFLVNNIGDMKE